MPCKLGLALYEVTAVRMTSPRDFERRGSNSALPHGITKISKSVYLLREPEGPPTIEIVFVHGISRSAYKDAYWSTWISKPKYNYDVEEIWPITWLPRRFPGARVLSLSYKPSFSNILAKNWSTVQKLAVDMVDRAKVGQWDCPVVFACHCVGELVAKAIVTRSLNELSSPRLDLRPKFQKFFENIRGFYFYATPHQGFSLAIGWPMIDAVLGKMSSWNNNELGHLNLEFEEIERGRFANRWKFAVVEESRPATFNFSIRAAVVTRKSARHVYDNYVSPLADHFEVCKPKDESDERFRALLRFIDDILVESSRCVNFERAEPPTKRHAVSRSELCDDEEITIFGVRDQAHSTGMLRRKFLQTKNVIQEILRRMEKLMVENEVMIWHKQCEHLLERYRVAVNTIVQLLDALAEGSMVSMNAPLVKFVSTTLIRSILEGEASLLFCSEQDNYNKAAFALSSPRYPLAPTFSRFGLVLRELDWTLDFMCCIKQQHVDGKSLSFDDWEWCEERCRLVFIPSGSVTMEDVSKMLEDDHCRQILDQDALRTSLASNQDNQGKLEDIWSKRLSPTSQLCDRNSLSDCFWIDNPLSREYEGILAEGAFKSVVKRKWLGETVAVGITTGFPKRQLIAEASLLARVQHPNVVELICCAYEEANPDSRSYLATELMEQDLDSLIHQQLKRRTNGSQATSDGPPFALPVAVDIALQIAEAMVHVRRCKVLHRDLKPKNCLVSPKYRKASCPDSVDVPTYYTTKLIDFGTSKLRGEDSYFSTLRQGTPSFMAPELNPESPGLRYTWSADVWSFGMTCYTIFTGKAPFAKNNLRDVSSQLRGGERPEFPLKFPSLLKKLIQRCWATNPSERPTIYEVREDLWDCKLYYEWPSNSAAH